MGNSHTETNSTSLNGREEITSQSTDCKETQLDMKRTARIQQDVNTHILDDATCDSLYANYTNCVRNGHTNCSSVYSFMMTSGCERTIQREQTIPSITPECGAVLETYNRCVTANNPDCLIMRELAQIAGCDNNLFFKDIQ